MGPVASSFVVGLAGRGCANSGTPQFGVHAMTTFTDGIIVAQATEDGEATFAANLKFDGDELGDWINAGYRADDGTIHVGSAATHTVTFVFDPAGLKRFKARRKAGDDKAHQEVIGHGTVDGAKVVGFYALTKKTGNSAVGLRPAVGKRVDFAEFA